MSGLFKQAVQINAVSARLKTISLQMGFCFCQDVTGIDDSNLVDVTRFYAITQHQQTPQLFPFLSHSPVSA